MNKTIHRIWLNEEPPPPALQRIGESWEGEDVEFWDHERVKTLDGIDEHLRLIDKLWKPHSVEWWRARSDVTRYAILRDHGGLYVDMDCEKVGDVWGELDTAPVGTVLAAFRPARPPNLDVGRCCNGVIWIPGDSSELMEKLLGIVYYAMEGSRHLPPKKVRPLYQTGPVQLNIVASGRDDVQLRMPPFAAFKGCETPDTRIIIHQGWRQYDA